MQQRRRRWNARAKESTKFARFDVWQRVIDREAKWNGQKKNRENRVRWGKLTAAVASTKHLTSKLVYLRQFSIKKFCWSYRMDYANHASVYDVLYASEWMPSKWSDSMELSRCDRKSESRFSSAIRVILSYLSFYVRLNQSTRWWLSVRERTITFFFGFWVKN